MNNENPPVEETRRRWAILGITYTCSLAFAITLQSVPPILSFLIAELNLSHTQAGLLMSLFALPGIIVAIPAGMLVDRYGQKTVGIVSLSLMTAGTAIFASGSSFPILGLGRVVAGAGAMTLSVLVPQLLAQRFAGHEIGIAMGVSTTAMPLATVISLNLLSALSEAFSWRASAWLNTGLTLAALIVFLFFFTGAPRKSQPILPGGQGLFRDIRSVGAPIWLVGTAWMLFNAAMISLFTFTPDFLSSSGFSVTSAGFLTSLVMWPALVLSPTVGYVIHKLDHKRAIIIIGSIIVAILIVLIPPATSQAMLLMFLLGIVQSMVPAPIFALIPEVVSPERLGLGFGINSTCLNIGIVVGPAIVGLARDVTGSYQASYVLMAVLTLLAALSVVILGKRKT